MDFSQVKNLQIPQGSVVKITDSNGNVLYNKKKTLYRQLEYIHLSGAEHLETGFKTKQGYPKEFTFSFEQSSGDNFIIGCYDSSLSANRRRYYLRHNSTNDLSLVLGNTWQSTVTCNVNQKYVTRMNVYKDGNYKMEWQLYDEWGNQWDSNIIDSGSTDVPTTKLATIGANNSNSIEYQFIGNIYLVREWAGGTSGNFDYPTTNTIFYPAQRKSDGVCGLYRINNNTFYPLIGTNITTTAAGPTANENPDWPNEQVDVIYGTFTATGGDGTSGYSNTNSPSYSSYPQSVTTISNIPDDAQYAYVSFKMHAGSLSGTQSGARNQFLLNGIAVQTNSAYKENQVYKVDSMNRTVTNMQVSLANSTTFAEIKTRETSSPEHSITFKFDKTSHTIKCTASAYQGNAYGGAKCWFSNISITIFR